MTERPNVLVVCGRNKRRSRTAEYIFKNDMRFSIRSVGLSPKSERQLKAKDLEWADLCLVMDNQQRKRIVDQYRAMELPELQVLQIDDVYEYLEPELIEILTEKINGTLKSTLNI
jgi:protein-tyrosine phosphatase